MKKLILIVCSILVIGYWVWADSFAEIIPKGFQFTRSEIENFSNSHPHEEIVTHKTHKQIVRERMARKNSFCGYVVIPAIFLSIIGLIIGFFVAESDRGRIFRAKRLLKKVWESEFQKLADRSLKWVSFNIENGIYKVKLANCFDQGDGSSWFEFDLEGSGEKIFRNTNWRWNEHYFVDSERVLRNCKHFYHQYKQRELQNALVKAAKISVEQSLI